MRIPRICVFEALSNGAEILLPAQAGEHLARVLRLERGHPIVLFNGNGRDYRAEISQLAKRAVSARVLDDGEAVSRESPLRLTLAQGVARGEKMDLILQKATELGVARIVPVAMERSVVRFAGDERADRRLAHWQAVAAAACEQCGRNRLPAIDAPMDLLAALAIAEASADLRLLLSPQGEDSLATAAPSAGVALLVGPEGGFEEREVDAALRHGFRAVRFGPRVLRTETAAVAAITALQVLAGDLRGVATADSG
ncbi:MAG: 16S rRNA (uracil(1498)-N(3))-methyltransferase [Dokdonella sp.]|nr:16S rRNA (uracil(1498)-N(3))-methyltransferase [Dokdonella sp.]